MVGEDGKDVFMESFLECFLESKMEGLQLVLFENFVDVVKFGYKVLVFGVVQAFNDFIYFFFCILFYFEENLF